ncbi:GNAT family N-acetyltransferase [Kitasatospora sp. CM 4170]|uniref:GNAT family N-acetyltransferase n=1 Tax=Kitasatospora aburaviensis TaxID=67265 RepID=A0ABW1EVI3_9ACTN|nr:GNAT family N-acetyltransferase [Kitasatospora sp. CM 4170]WNM45088.1 GNAT family N-acetyltransferase [Kitasatospora sp. CM 4170]
MADADANWEIGRAPDGLPVVRYVRGEREGRPWADLLEVLVPEGPTADAAGAGGVDRGGSTADPVGFVLSELSGWVVSGPVEFGGRLLHRGARTLRHGHTMYRDLAGDPPAAGWAAWAGTPLRNGLRAVPCDRPADDLLASCRAAYAPGHPDHRPGREDEAHERLHLLLTGQLPVGPVLPSSALAVDGDDRVVAGAVLTDYDGTPWLSDVFRHPDLGYPGLGRDLLRRALADTAATGAARVGLAVTEGNPARRLYEDLGFQVTRSSLTVVVP